MKERGPVIVALQRDEFGHPSLVIVTEHGSATDLRAEEG